VDHHISVYEYFAGVCIIGTIRDEEVGRNEHPKGWRR